jgi:nucleotide-binding universal stress UspA family protein
LIHEREGAKRAIRRLLAEHRSRDTEVRLLAVVEVLIPGKVSIYLSEAQAEKLAREAAARWIDDLESILKSAGIQYTSEIAVGSPKKLIPAAMARTDVDRVLLPARSPHWWARWTASHRENSLGRSLHRPVSVVP